MFEMANTGNDHGHSQLISLINRILILQRTTGVDDRRDARRSRSCHTIIEGEEGI